LSYRSFGRTTNCSASEPVRKNPPRSSSRKHVVGQRARLPEPPDVEGGFVEREAPVGHERVVVEIAGAAGSAVAPRAKESSVLAPHLREDELGGRFRRSECFTRPKLCLGRGESTDGEPVPGCEHLVVGRRRDPLGTAFAEGQPQVHQPETQLDGIHRGVLREFLERSGVPEDVRSFPIATR
jgi:hypothetical protein